MFGNNLPQQKTNPGQGAPRGAGAIMILCLCQSLERVKAGRVDRYIYIYIYAYVNKYIYIYIYILVKIVINYILLVY